RSRGAGLRAGNLVERRVAAALLCLDRDVLAGASARDRTGHLERIETLDLARARLQRDRRRRGRGRSRDCEHRRPDEQTSPNAGTVVLVRGNEQRSTGAPRYRHASFDVQTSTMLLTPARQ